MNRHSDQQVLQGIVDDVVYRSEDGRFAVVRFHEPQDDEEDPPHTAVGDLGRIVPGEHLRLVGRWTEHAVYGPRFRVSGYTPTLPTTENGIARYLGSGLIEGIGKGLAQRLVDRFGVDTLDVIATEPGRLRDVPGIGKQRAESIAKAIQHKRVEAEALTFLHSLGLGPATAREIIKRFGADAPAAVRDNPYLVAEQIRGIGFRTADRIGEAVGIGHDDLRRVQGAVLHVLARAVDEGHVFYATEEIRQGLETLDVPSTQLRDAVESLQTQGLVVRDGDALYPPTLHSAEMSVALSLSKLANRTAQKLEPATKPDELTDTQWQAVQASLRTNLLVLTGGPGTGKTTTVRAIVDAHRHKDRRVALCAPTGRAAKRLADASDTEAKTIHRLLEWNPATGRFNRDADRPIDAELILVDEASMLDIRLAAQLFDAVPPSSTLVLVGDVDQLPPVGPGQPLRDLIDSKTCPTVRLQEVFRQAQQSAIVRGAHAILEGRMPEPTPTGTKGDGDLFVIALNDPEAASSRIVKVLERMVTAYDLDPKRDVQVMSPMRKGPLGTTRLNELLQDALNPTAGETTPTFRVGDKVMQLRNDYDRDVFNGDLGEVRRVEGGITYISFDGRDVQYDVDALDAVSLAYACTIHKVQGSEFSAAVVVMHDSHFVLLNRALLYTAVTRAKRLVVLLGSQRAFARAARNALTYNTNSRLRERLIELASN